MKMIVEPVTAFLDRVNMLEGFKHLGITLFDLKFDSTEELYNLATGYIYEDPNSQEALQKSPLSFNSPIVIVIFRFKLVQVDFALKCK